MFRPLVLASVALALALLAAGLSGPAGAASLEVTVVDVRPDDGGRLVVRLYRGEEDWLEREAAVAERVVALGEVTADSARVDFPDLEPDTTWAVTVLHDRNGNGAMDMRWFPWPKPKEGTGVSNDRWRRGPPEYEDARLAIEGDAVPIRIRMWYP